MRLHLRLSATNQSVPFDYQHALTGALHKWLGAENLLHDSISLYSTSWLHGGHGTRTHINFPHGADWFISFHNEAHIEPLVNRALREPVVCHGMSVMQINQQPTPRFGTAQTFKVASPVLARAPKNREEAGHVKHLLYTDPESDDVLTQTLHHKMDVAGLDSRHKETHVRFDRTYRGAKTRLVTIKNIQSRASVCPVHITGTTEGIGFAWNVGVGHSTGSGFGCLL